MVSPLDAAKKLANEVPSVQVIRRSQATLIVEMMSDVQLWHTPEYAAFATIQLDTHKENWPIGSRRFRRWLSGRFYEQAGSTPNAQALQDALGVLGGQAIFDGAEHSVWTRLAGGDDVIYVDLGDEAWRVVEVTTEGWRVVANPPVRFRRPRGTLPLPWPTEGGSVNELRRFLNVGSEEDWPLVSSWLAAAARPQGPYPVMVIHGEQGSAKTTAARVLRATIDPNVAILRSEPKEVRDLMIAATNSWCVALDNLSRLPTWLSDAICLLSTGGGFSTRTLYEDQEETILEAQRPVIINGITELATRGDLLDRSLVIYLPAIPEGRHLPESEFWPQFYEARPDILGGLLDVLSAALKALPTVTLERTPRMADFAYWAVAAEPKLGLTSGRFIAAYIGNRASANELTLEASPVVPHLRDLVKLREWNGTSTELLVELNRRVDEKTQRQKTWPSSPRSLSNTLRRLAPNLRAVGIDMQLRPDTWPQLQAVNSH